MGMNYYIGSNGMFISENQLMRKRNIRYVDLNQDEMMHYKYIKREKLPNGKYRYYYAVNDGRPELDTGTGYSNKFTRGKTLSGPNGRLKDSSLNDSVKKFTRGKTLSGPNGKLKDTNIKDAIANVNSNQKKKRRTSSKSLSDRGRQAVKNILDKLGIN